MDEYIKYRSGLQTLEEYKKHMKPLDDEIDKLELQNLSLNLQDTPASEISFLKHLH